MVGAKRVPSVRSTGHLSESRGDRASQVLRPSNRGDSVIRSLTPGERPESIPGEPEAKKNRVRTRDEHTPVQELEHGM